MGTLWEEMTGGKYSDRAPACWTLESAGSTGLCSLLSHFLCFYFKLQTEQETRGRRERRAMNLKGEKQRFKKKEKWEVGGKGPCHLLYSHGNKGERVMTVL